MGSSESVQENKQTIKQETPQEENKTYTLSLLELKTCLEYYGTFNLPFEDFVKYEKFLISYPLQMNFEYHTPEVKINSFVHNNRLSYRQLLDIKNYTLEHSVIISSEDYKLFQYAKSRCESP